MKPNHKVATRVCPQCQVKKTFDARNGTCSKECADARKAQAAAPSETHAVVGDTWTIHLPKTPIHTLEQLLEHCKVDTGVWEVERFVVNKWEVGAKDADQKIKVTPLFQVKAFLKRRAVMAAIAAEIKALKEDAKRGIHLIKADKKADTTRKTKSGIMLEIGIPDLHMGKLAWAKETGHQNYDSRIAAELFRRAVDSLVQRTRGYQIEQICFVVGNDLLNVDNTQNTTTHGTPQHCDVRFQKTYRATRIMVADAINLLRTVAPVRAVVVPGNHDTLSAWCLGDSLECLFHGAKDVVIENHPTKRKYFQWGKVMLMWCHGDKGKHDKYPLLMATEQNAMFGATTWREIHVGHLHQVQLRELNGVRVRILPSLCAPDAWHAEMGYVGNIRSAEAYIWDKEEGLLGTAVYAAPDDLELAA